MKTQEAVFGWYTLQTNSNWEFKVKEELEKRLEKSSFKGAIKDILIPTKMVTKVKNGKKTNRVQKFYPRYIFVKAQLQDEAGNWMQELLSWIRAVPGVQRFLEKEGRPVAVPQSEIDNILNEVEVFQGKRNLKVAYEVNESITIIDGPFSGMTGVINEVDLNKGQLKVSVNIFGRLTPVDLECWQVQKVRK